MLMQQGSGAGRHAGRLSSSLKPLIILQDHIASTATSLGLWLHVQASEMTGLRVGS